MAVIMTTTEEMQKEVKEATILTLLFLIKDIENEVLRIHRYEYSRGCVQQSNEGDRIKSCEPSKDFTFTLYLEDIKK